MEGKKGEVVVEMVHLTLPTIRTKRFSFPPVPRQEATPHHIVLNILPDREIQGKSPLPSKAFLSTH